MPDSESSVETRPLYSKTLPTRIAFYRYFRPGVQQTVQRGRGFGIVSRTRQALTFRPFRTLRTSWTVPNMCPLPAVLFLTSTLL